MKIEKDKVIAIDYVMEDEDGDTLENTIETGPGEFIIGHDQLKIIFCGKPNPFGVGVQHFYFNRVMQASEFWQ